MLEACTICAHRMLAAAARADQEELGARCASLNDITSCRKWESPPDRALQAAWAMNWTGSLEVYPTTFRRGRGRPRRRARRSRHAVGAHTMGHGHLAYQLPAPRLKTWKLLIEQEGNNAASCRRRALPSPTATPASRAVPRGSRAQPQALHVRGRLGPNGPAIGEPRKVPHVWRAPAYSFMTSGPKASSSPSTDEAMPVNPHPRRPARSKEWLRGTPAEALAPAEARGQRRESSWCREKEAA